MRLRSGLAILLSAFTLTSSATGATLLVNGSRGRLVWPRDSTRASRPHGWDIALDRTAQRFEPQRHDELLQPAVGVQGDVVGPQPRMRVRGEIHPSAVYERTHW